MTSGWRSTVGGTAGVVLLAGLFLWFARDAGTPPVAAVPVERVVATSEPQSVSLQAPSKERSALSAPEAVVDHADAARTNRVRVRTRLGLPLGGLEWRASGDSAWVAVEDAGLEAELALPEDGLEVRCRAHRAAASRGEDVVLEPIASLLLRSEVGGAFSRGVRTWSPLAPFGADHPTQREVDAVVLLGPVASGFAIALDVPRFQRVRGAEAQYTTLCTLRSAHVLQVSWQPRAGLHVEEPLDDELFEPVPSATLRVIARPAWQGPTPGRMRWSLTAGSSGATRQVVRDWGRMWFTPRPLFERETWVGEGPLVVEDLPLDHEYGVFVRSEDDEHVGRTEFRFDGTERAVDLHPGLRLRGRIDLRGVSVRPPVHLEVIVHMGAQSGRDHLWQDRTRLDLDPTLEFEVPALRRELGEGVADFPPPRTGVVRLVVAGFEPWEERLTWPSDRSLLDLGTVTLEPHAPDVVLPSAARREEGHWVAVLTASEGGWPVEATISVGDDDWLRFDHEDRPAFDAGEHGEVLALCSGETFDDGVGFERNGEAWRALESADYRLRIRLGEPLAPGERLLLGWSWHGCRVSRGGFDLADFADGREVELAFRAPARDVVLYAQRVGAAGTPLRDDTRGVLPGPHGVRIF